MKKKQVITSNYLEKIPARHPDIIWSEDSEGKVTLEIENKGFFNRVAQKLFRKPKTSYVHLDDNGSFAWKQTDGKSDIIAIGKKVEEHFGEAANPLYERLAKFFQILDSYHFIVWKN